MTIKTIFYISIFLANLIITIVIPTQLFYTPIDSYNYMYRLEFILNHKQWGKLYRQYLTLLIFEPVFMVLYYRWFIFTGEFDIARYTRFFLLVWVASFTFVHIAEYIIFKDYIVYAEDYTYLRSIFVIKYLDIYTYTISAVYATTMYLYIYLTIFL